MGQEWRRLGAAAAVHVAPKQGAYPYGSSVLVSGPDRAVLVDPSLAIAELDQPPPVDEVIVSHAHEDHIAGLARYPDRPVWAPDADLIGIQSLEGLLTIYGMPPDVERVWITELLDTFRYVPRADATGFADGHRWDLGGGVTIEAIHLPGHTRGHSALLVEPDGALYLGDIELTGFGPYYGDAWSSLEDWLPTLQRVRDVDARWFVTFHHKGVIDGRDEFLELLDAYEAVIHRRERELLEFLQEPRTVAEIVEHRFVYRPGVDLIWVDYVEERSMTQHLERLVAGGRVEEVEPGRYRAS